MNINTLKFQVESVLKDFPESRNSDITLLVELWKRYYPDSISNFVATGASISLDTLYSLPQEGAVGRIRRFIQNDKTRTKELRYLPTNPEIIKQRRMSEDLWREEMKEPSCAGGRCYFKGETPDVCPNVRPGYKFHTEVACQKCGKHSLWGISWNQDKEKDFICDDCKKENPCGKPHNNGEPMCIECETIKLKM